MHLHTCTHARTHARDFKARAPQTCISTISVCSECACAALKVHYKRLFVLIGGSTLAVRVKRSEASSPAVSRSNASVQASHIHSVTVCRAPLLDRAVTNTDRCSCHSPGYPQPLRHKYRGLVCVCVQHQCARRRCRCVAAATVTLSVPSSALFASEML